MGEYKVILVFRYFGFFRIKYLDYNDLKIYLGKSRKNRMVCKFFWNVIYSYDGGICLGFNKIRECED